MSLSETSLLAGRRSHAFAAPERAKVFAYIEQQRDFGATREEIAQGTGIPEKSVTWRVRELKDEGRIVDSGRERTTSSGCRAEVLRLVRYHCPHCQDRGCFVCQGGSDG